MGYFKKTFESFKETNMEEIDGSGIYLKLNTIADWNKARRLLDDSLFYYDQHNHDEKWFFFPEENDALDMLENDLVIFMSENNFKNYSFKSN